MMPILEARFYPRSRADSSFVVVGRVVCDGQRTSIIPADLAARTVRPFDADGLQSKLKFLVACATSDPHAELRQLRSDFWFFAEVNEGGESPP